MKAIIDPSANVYYFSFYIQGLYDVLEKRMSVFLQNILNLYVGRKAICF